MNAKSNNAGSLAMLLASGSPGSAAAWLRNIEFLQAEHRSEGKDAVSEVARKVEQDGKGFSFLP